MPQVTDQLLQHVARRSRLATLGGWFFRLSLLFALIYLVLFVLARLLSLIPDGFAIWTVAIVPAAALLAALVLHRSIDRAQAARLVDLRMKTKDLFLTAALLDRSPGEYQPLIAQTAEEQARAIRPAMVVPFQGWNQAAIIVLTLGLLALGAWLTPTFDPFKKEQAKQQIAQRIAKLEKEKEAAKEKVEALKQKNVESVTSKEVEQALEELKKTFDQMKKEEKEKNLARLNEQQRTLSEKWKQVQEQKLKETSLDKPSRQTLGKQDSPNVEKWKQELEQGKTDELKKELEKIEQLADQAKDGKSAEEQKAAQQELQQRMQELSEFVKDAAGNKQANESMKKAMEQLAQSKDPQAKKEATDAMKESMKLTEKQLEQMAQSKRDQKSLEEALQSIQDAKKLNEKQQLDGKECQECQNMSQLAKKLSEKSGGNSPSSTASKNGKPGEKEGSEESPSLAPGAKKDPTGKAGESPTSETKEDPTKLAGGGKEKPGNSSSIKAGTSPGGDGSPIEDAADNTAFRSEKAKSALQAGKSLMQWKTDDPTEAGESNVKYREAIEKVKQGASEAILQEQIPPGYHETIQKYFDAVEKSTPRNAEKADKKAPTK